MRHDNRRSSPVRQPRDSEIGQSYAFRRSRTITGSAATSVRAAGEERGQLQSPRLHEHSLRKHRRKLSLYLFVAVSTAGLLLYVVTSYIGTDITVGMQSSQPTRTALDEPRYRELANGYFMNHPFERFDFALNEKTFSEYMIQAAPEIGAAKLDNGSGIGKGMLALRLREPVVAWTIKGQQYFVDAEGEAFTVNYFATPSVVVTDKSGVSADAGVVASGKLLRFIGRVITLVNQSSGDSPVESVELPSNSTRQVDFKLAGHPYVIKAHLDRDPAGQAADIVSAVTYVKAKGITPQYLDVRVSSRAYYRDKE